LKHYNYSDLIHRMSNYVIMTITKIANNLKCAIFLRRSTDP
jgi:predicted urease superfamily metal-dependent hydrolase